MNDLLWVPISRGTKRGEFIAGGQTGDRQSNIHISDDNNLMKMTTTSSDNYSAPTIIYKEEGRTDL